MLQNLQPGKDVPMDFFTLLRPGPADFQPLLLLPAPISGLIFSTIIPLEIFD